MGSVLDTPQRIFGVGGVHAPCPACNEQNAYWKAVGGFNALAQRYKHERCGRYSEIVAGQLTFKG
jgi:transposase-like protein